VLRLALVLVLLAGSAFARPPRIVVDPGHGGTQEGAVGPDALLEKDLALQVAEQVKAVLEQTLNAEVHLTRSRDALVHLSARVAQANKLSPDLFLSIHANSMPTRALRARTRGIETYFLSASATGEEARSTAARENAEGPRQGRAGGDGTLAFILQDLQRTEAHGDSSRLAYAVQKALVKEVGAEDRGVQQAPFYVLTGVEAPAILVEVGFISNPEEARKLRTPAYRRKLAEGIARGVGRFLSEVRGRDHRAAASARAP
jgi:N-acetylmuramoyl-L-alanine amidase